MTKYLVIVNGYFGDIAFSTSIARRLREMFKDIYIDYLIGFPQMQPLLQNDKNINNVFVSKTPSPHPKIDLETTHYTKLILIGQMQFDIPPPIQMQIEANIENPTSEFYLFTNPEYDKIAANIIGQLKIEHKKPVVCVMSNWEERSFGFTEEEYKNGKDKHNNLGYGNRRRNINYIIQGISNYVYPIEVGFPSNTSQLNTVTIPNSDQKSILFECSLMKYCDAFLGAEGGLCNLAAGVGTKTIITGDFVHQVYGYNGSVKQIKEPKLGPIHYFNNKGHIELNPYLTDNEVITEILKNV